jgi:DNA-binding SARP family transcriptional activator
MFDIIYRLFEEQLSQIKSDTRILVVHPNYSAQHLVLASFLSHEATAYVRFREDHLTYSQLLEIVRSTTQGINLPDVRYLILDECDFVGPKDFEQLLTLLLREVTRGVLVILARTMPPCILSNADLRHQAQIIPVSDSLMFHDYIGRADGPALLEVKGFGSGHALLNGRPIDNWDGALPRNLFFYLIDRGMATRNQIFETFWPEMPVREATNVFHVTKRKISEVLGTDLTYYWSGFYRLSPEIELSYDISLFSQMMQESAIASHQNAQRLLTQAIWLYRGDFLTSIHDDVVWVAQRRSELLQTYGDALITRAKTFEHAGDKLEALGLYIRASSTSPQREDLTGTIMKLYTELGMYGDALNAYNRLEVTIMDTLGISPAQWLQDLAIEIQDKAREAVKV